MKHKNIDIMHLNKCPDYDIIYCDPPWEERMVKYFETIMEKSGHKKPNNTISEILYKLGELADTNKPLFIEYSVKNHERVIKIMESFGHKFNKVFESIYDGNRPYVIISFNTSILIENGLKDQLSLKRILEKTKAKTVFDMFAGIGVICKIVEDYGCEYIGYELNPERFKKLIKVTRQC